MVQLRDDHEQALAEIKSKQKLRDSAEQQILFNEALAKLKEENTEKDNEIKQLKSNLHLKSKGTLIAFRIHHAPNVIFFFLINLLRLEMFIYKYLFQN